MSGVAIGNGVVATDVASTASITSGTINNATIGATTPSTGAFTTLTATTPSVSDNSTNVATTAWATSKFANVMIAQGSWNASTNTPTLASSVGTATFFYIVSVAGSTSLNGISSWSVGDWAVFNGTVWVKIDNQTVVASVSVAGTGLSENASTGAITITSNATANNTINTIVARDAEGDFIAGTITAELDGNAATSTTAPSGINTGDQFLFKTIAVADQSNIVADTVADTLTIVAGSNITLTTNASTDTLTIAASGGGALTATSITATDSSLDIAGLDGTGTDNGGDIYIYSGTSGNGATGNAGNVYLQANDTSATNGDGGFVEILGGYGHGTGAGGHINIAAGKAATGAGNGVGGDLTLSSGDGKNAGNGGDLTITPGAGGATGIAGKVKINTSVGQGSGMKHQRVTTGSISAGSTALVTLTWTTTFADANYTVQASVLDSTTSSLSLSVVHIESISASAITVRILNNSVGALTGILHVIAMHD